MRHALDVWRSFWSRSPHDRARLVKAAWRSLSEQGIARTARQVRKSTDLASDRDAERRRYLEWCAAHTPDAAEQSRMSAASRSFAYQPLVSIVTAVYNTDPKWLEACASSVMAQIYERWEWQIANDGSTRADTLDALSRLRSRDPRIHVHDLDRNRGISAASNVALHAARGEYVGLLDHDDALVLHALFRIVEHLNRAGKRPDVVYTDEDKLDEDGQRCDAYFKPDWSPDLFLSNMYPCHFLVLRRELAIAAGGFRTAFDFSQDYDLMLRVMERANRIDHVADVVYHWRKVPQSTATAGSAKPTAHLAGERALQDYLGRNGIDGHVVGAGSPGFYRIVYDIGRARTVSIVGPRSAADQERLRGQTAYPRLEFVDAAADATGEFFVCLDAAYEPRDPEWLDALLQALRPGVGAVGGKLLRADGTLEHVGLVLGLDGLVGRPFLNAPEDHPGYFGNAILIRTVSAISGACLLTSREWLDAVGGFDQALGAEAAALDYCLKVQRAGGRVVFTPWSVMKRVAAAPVPEPTAAEAEVLRTRWPDAFRSDPFYNPNLSRQALDFRVGR